jgi:hypothetical protein
MDYGYYQSNDVYMLQLEVTEKHLGCIRIYSSRGSCSKTAIELYQYAKHISPCHICAPP